MQHVGFGDASSAELRVFSDANSAGFRDFFPVMLVLQAPSCAAQCVPVHVLKLLFSDKPFRSWR